MLKAPPFNPRTYISRYYNFGQTMPTSVDLIFYAPNVATSDLGRFDGYCHYKFDIYIRLPRMSMSED